MATYNNTTHQLAGASLDAGMIFAAFFDDSNTAPVVGVEASGNTNGDRATASGWEPTADSDVLKFDVPAGFDSDLGTLVIIQEQATLAGHSQYGHYLSIQNEAFKVNLNTNSDRLELYTGDNSAIITVPSNVRDTAGVVSARWDRSAPVRRFGMNNGFAQGTTSWTSSGALSGQMLVGNRSDLIRPTGEKIVFVGLWDRYLSDSEISQVVTDHYQLVQPIGDTTAPVLSTPTGTKTGSTTATGSVSTDEGNGTLYYYASTNSSETAATIKASGSSQAVSATGSQAVSFTGLTASTTYYAHYVQDDTALNESNVANSTSFTTDAATTTLNSIDADNNVQVGQTGVVIATTGVDPASVVQTVTLGGEALTVTAWTNVGGNAQITVTIPAAIALKWGRTDLTLSVTDDAGTYTLGGITLSAPTGWESVAFTTAPNEATTESFYEYAKTDATIGSYTLVAGDVLAWTTSTGLTVDGQTIPTVSPAATVTGSYKVWKELTSTWTAESTYTITDLGVFVEPAVLSSASASYSSATSAIATVNTDSITGTLYGYVSTNATELAATIKASGSSQAVTSGTESMVFTGLTTDTTYYAHFIQNNGQDSNIITTNSFTPQVSASGDARAIVTSMVSNIVSNMVN